MSALPSPQNTPPRAEDEPRPAKPSSQQRQLEPIVSPANKKKVRTLNRSGPVLVEDLKAEAGLGLDALRLAEKQHPGDPLRQLDTFFGRFVIPAATGRIRSASMKTHEAYKARLRRSVVVLAEELNMRLQNLSELSKKHVVKLTRYMEDEGNSSSYLSNVNTALRRFAIWIGKPNLAPRVRDLLKDPDRARRQYAAIEPKTLSAAGIDIDALVAVVDGLSKPIGCQLRLMLGFGLRMEEVVMLRPHAADHGDQLYVEDGAKGGRSRFVPIDDDHKRALVEEAKVLAESNNKRVLSDRPRAKLLQAKRRFRYVVCEKAGLTEAQLGATPHGCRHEYANKEYKRITGFDSPVAGGPLLDKSVDRPARKKIMEALGHGDPNKGAAYLGPIRGVNPVLMDNLVRLLKRVQADQALAAEVKAAEVTALWLLGPPAEGRRLQGLVVVGWSTATGELSVAQETSLKARLGACLQCSTFLLLKMGSAGTSGLPAFEFI